MAETNERELTGDDREPTTHGTTVADERHVSEEEAQAARNVDEVKEELPEADPNFDEDEEEF
jgi:hypothetical protein